MWRGHFVVLSKMPTQRRLIGLADGYQIFREDRSGLLFLTPGSAIPRARPDFSEGFASEGNSEAHFLPLASFLSEKRDGLVIQSHEVSFDLVETACSLATQLGQLVLVSEETDDDFAMAVVADQGVVTYLRFRTAQPDATTADVVYRSGHGFTVAAVQPQEASGVTEAAIEDVLAVPIISVRDFSEPKPSKGKATRYARQLSVPVDAYLERFGEFELLRSAPPPVQHSRMTVLLRHAGSGLALPFILVGMVLFAVFRSGNAKAGNNVGLPILFLTGLTATAGPIAAIILLLWI